jgi:hypothetical protein
MFDTKSPFLVDIRRIMHHSYIVLVAIFLDRPIFSLFCSAIYGPYPMAPISYRGRSEGASAGNYYSL